GVGGGGAGGGRPDRGCGRGNAVVVVRRRGAGHRHDRRAGAARAGYAAIRPRRVEEATMTRFRLPPAVVLLLAAPLAADDDPLPAGALARFGNPRFRHGPPAYALAVTPDGHSVVAAGGGGVTVLDAHTAPPRPPLR